MKIKLKALVFIFLFSTAICFAQTSGAGGSGGAGTSAGGLSQGESLFKENNAKDAVQVLEYEILNGQISENTYNFLGLGYYQLGDYEKSLDAFRRGLKAQPDNIKLLSYNMGNTYYAIKDYTSAVNCYSDSLKAAPTFYEALLNRANALLMAGQLTSAKEDYQLFIIKSPDDPQKERIEMLIKALEEEIARREEEARLLAEQNKAKWEEFDESLNSDQEAEYIPDWEQFESELADGRSGPYDPEWERINHENPESFEEHNPAAQVINWEEFENEGGAALADSEIVDSEAVSDEDWLAFSEEELEEMKRLEEESREEHERWLEEERRRQQEIATREAQKRAKEQQLSLEEERKLREQLLEDMRKSEEERRKKLLEDVANSLQGSDSTNLTSGAEDLIDYDLEGELD